MKRRGFLQSAAALPGLAAQTTKTTPLKVVCVGGHPDNPESDGGGTLARYAEAGHRVSIGVVVLKTISGARICNSLVHGFANTVTYLLAAHLPLPDGRGSVRSRVQSRDRRGAVPQIRHRNSELGYLAAALVFICSGRPTNGRPLPVQRLSSAANLNVLGRLKRYGFDWPPMDADQHRSSNLPGRALL
jgi:hypothetical protein